MGIRTPGLVPDKPPKRVSPERVYPDRVLALNVRQTRGLEKESTQLGPVYDAELAVDPPHVHLHGVGADPQSGSDRLDRAAGDHELGHLRLTRTQAQRPSSPLQPCVLHAISVSGGNLSPRRGGRRRTPKGPGLTLEQRSNSVLRRVNEISAQGAIPLAPPMCVAWIWAPADVKSGVRGRGRYP